MIGSIDVAVIGGGVIGSSIAYYLAKENLKVSLFERGELASGASGANQGAVVAQFFKGRLLDLVTESKKMFRSLVYELGYDFEVDVVGSVICLDREDQWPVIEANAQELRQKNVSVKLISGKELRELDPDFAEDIPGASVCEDDLLLDPIKLVYGFALAAEKLGAEVNKFTEVRKIKLENGEVRSILTDRGEIKTNFIVNAAGAWSPIVGEMVGLKIPVRPRRGQIIVTEPVRLARLRNVLDADYLTTAFDLEAVTKAKDPRIKLGVAASLTQPRSGNWLLGSSRDSPGLDERTTVETLRYIARRAIRFIPKLENVNIIRTFAGLRPLSDDGKHIVGKVEGIEGLVLATAHHGEGIVFAPVTGKLVAELIKSGRPSLSIDEFNLSRFNGGRDP